MKLENNKKLTPEFIQEIDEKLGKVPVFNNVTEVESHKVYNSKPADKYDYGLV